MKRAFVFPGQGSQAVGMGQALSDAFPEARLVFEEVDEALKQKLSRLMFEGPADQLTLTENAQPALMAVSMAALRSIEGQGGKDVPGMVAYVAGHSLGEYSALAAAGALGLDQAARLLKLRGRAMQAAVPVGEGAMAAVLGMEFEDVGTVVEDAAESDVCAVANDNAPGQVVVSGDAGAVGRAVDLAKERGARRAMLLQVSAPFHCALMAPAAEALQEALAKESLAGPSVPLVANVTADLVSAPDTIRRLLVEQVCGMVRWRESMLKLRALGVESVVEVGAGKVLSGLMRRIEPDVTAGNVATPDDVEAFLKNS